MRASEIYSLPTISEDSWDAMPDDVIAKVFHISEDACDTLNLREGTLTGHKKSETAYTHGRDYDTLHTMNFEYCPFAIIRRQVRNGSAISHEVLITDRDVFVRAHSFILTLTRDDGNDHSVRLTETEVDFSPRPF